jgi:ABC-2 type transport system permease protein
VFVASQVPSFAPQVAPAFKNFLAAELTSGRFDASSALSWPARAVLGEPVPLLTIMGFSWLFFYGMSRVLGKRFAAVAASAAGADAKKRRRVDVRPLRGFSAGFRRAMFRKELRLLARDPVLISQVLLRLLYFAPIAVLLMRKAPLGGDEKLIAGSAGVLVFFTCQIASSLAWIVISAEGAPELVKSAPVTKQAAQNAKLAAAILPVLVLSAIPAGVLAWFHPWAGLLTLLGAGFGAFAVGHINLWYEKPQPRSNFQRRGQGSLAVSLGEFSFGIFLMFAVVLAASPSLPGFLGAFISAGLATGLLGLLYWGRNRDA